VRFLRAWVPGFRSGKVWKLVTALSVYGIVGFFALLGIVTTYPTVVVLAAGVLLLWLLALNAGDVRTRSPGLGSPTAPVAIGSWMGVVLVILFLAGQADSLFLSADTIARRNEPTNRAREARPSATILAEAASTPRTDPAATLLVVSSPTQAAAPTPTVIAAASPPSVTAAPTAIATPVPTAAPSANTPTQSPVDLLHFVPAVDGYDRGGGGLVCEAGRTSSSCFYFGASRPGATTAGAFVKVTLLGSAAQAIADLPDYMHHVDEAQVQIGELTASGAWRPVIGTVADPSYMIGMTYGRLVIVVDVQRVTSTRAVTMDWARRFATAYVAEITTYPKP
jgi:hypothetical protein